MEPGGLPRDLVESLYLYHALGGWLEEMGAEITAAEFGEAWFDMVFMLSGEGPFFARKAHEQPFVDFAVLIDLDRAFLVEDRERLERILALAAEYCLSIDLHPTPRRDDAFCFALQIRAFFPGLEREALVHLIENLRSGVGAIDGLVRGG